MSLRHPLIKYFLVLLFGCCAIDSFSQNKKSTSHASIPKTDDMLKVHPIILTALPNGVSDIRLYRVMSFNGAKGIDIEGSSGTK